MPMVMPPRDERRREAGATGKATSRLVVRRIRERYRDALRRAQAVERAAAEDEPNAREVYEHVEWAGKADAALRNQVERIMLTAARIEGGHSALVVDWLARRIIGSGGLPDDETIQRVNALTTALQHAGSENVNAETARQAVAAFRLVQKNAVTKRRVVVYETHPGLRTPLEALELALSKHLPRE